MKKRNLCSVNSETLSRCMKTSCSAFYTKHRDRSRTHQNQFSFRHSSKGIILGAMEEDKDKEKTTDEKKPEEQVTKKKEHKSGSSSVFVPMCILIV